MTMPGLPPGNIPGIIPALDRPMPRPRAQTPDRALMSVLASLVLNKRLQHGTPGSSITPNFRPPAGTFPQPSPGIIANPPVSRPNSNPGLHLGFYNPRNPHYTPGAVPLRRPSQGSSNLAQLAARALAMRSRRTPGVGFNPTRHIPLPPTY